jgi:cell wall-associated NlpC family hydrolase
VARAYKGGDLTTMTALLLSGSPDTLLDQLNSLNLVTRARQQELTDYTRAKAERDDRKKQLDALHARQAVAQKALAAQKATIQKKLTELYAEQAKIMADIAAAQAGDTEAETANINSARTATTAPNATATDASPGASTSSRAAIAVKYAYAAIGKPYVWATAGPRSYDCSGLTLAAWRAAGIKLPHYAAAQWAMIRHIPRASLQPGDLVFYEKLGHVAIYVGNGVVIHAPQPGEKVKLSSVNMMPPYGFGRVV